MKGLVLALAAAITVALSVPATAQSSDASRYYRPWGGPLYYYDSVTGAYYGGIEVTPRARSYRYDRLPYRDGYRSWDDRYVIGDGYRRGWWRGW